MLLKCKHESVYLQHHSVTFMEWHKSVFERSVYDLNVHLTMRGNFSQRIKKIMDKNNHIHHFVL